MFAEFKDCTFGLTLIAVSATGSQWCISVAHPSEVSRTQHIKENLKTFTEQNTRVGDYKEHLQPLAARRAVDHVMVITTNGPRSTHIQRYRWSEEMQRFNTAFSFDF